MKKVMLIIVMCLLPALAFAQGETPEPGIDWGGIIAIFINAVLVVVVTEFLKLLRPRLPASVKRIVALVAGPALMALSTYVSGALGHPVDFGPWITVLTGIGSVPMALGLFDTVGRVSIKPARKALERTLGKYL